MRAAPCSPVCSSEPFLRLARHTDVRRTALVLVIAATPTREAVADDGIAVHVKRETIHEPYLTIDPILRSNFEGLTGETEHHDTVVTIGNTSVIVEGIATANVDRPWRVTEDLESRGWRASVRVSRKIGPFDFDAWAAIDSSQTRFGGGTYRDVGASLSKRFSLSRWMKAWISLSISNRTWLGDALPPGEANATTVMLSVGTTFR